MITPNNTIQTILKAPMNTWDDFYFISCSIAFILLNIQNRAAVTHWTSWATRIVPHVADVAIPTPPGGKNWRMSIFPLQLSPSHLATALAESRKRLSAETVCRRKRGLSIREEQVCFLLFIGTAVVQKHTPFCFLHFIFQVLLSNLNLLCLSTVLYSSSSSKKF